MLVARDQRDEVEPVSWIRIDDHFAFHRKVILAGNSAVGCWIRCMAQCGAYGTKGFVAAEIARSIGSKKDLGALTSAGLWSPVQGGEKHVVTGRRDSGKRKLPDVEVTMPGPGYFIRDFLHYHWQEEAGAAAEQTVDHTEAVTVTAPAQPRARSPARAQVSSQVRTQTSSTCEADENSPEFASEAQVRSLTRPDQTQTRPSQSNPTRPSPTPPNATRALEAHDSAPQRVVALLPGGSPEDEVADPEDEARRVLCRLADLGWRSKMRGNKHSTGTWEATVRKIVREQGLTVVAIDAVLKFAEEKALPKGKNPMDLLGKWINPEWAEWKTILAEIQDQKKHNEKLAEGRAAQRAAARDIHHHANGDPKPARDVLDGIYGDPKP